jgi:hypothetical protein
MKNYILLRKDTNDNYSIIGYDDNETVLESIVENISCLSDNTYYIYTLRESLSLSKLWVVSDDVPPTPEIKPIIKVNFDTTTDIANYTPDIMPILGSSILEVFASPTTSILIPEDGNYKITGSLELIKESTTVSYPQSTIAIYVSVNGIKATQNYVTDFDSGTNEQIKNITVSDTLNLVTGDTLELNYVLLYGDDAITVRNNSDLSYLKIEKE